MRLPFMRKHDPLLEDESLPAREEMNDTPLPSSTLPSPQEMPSMPQPPVTPSSPAGSVMTREELAKEFELLNAKLNYLKSVLDQVNERLKRLEERRW